MKFWQQVALVCALAALGVVMLLLGLLPGRELLVSAPEGLPCADLPGRAVPSLGARHLAYLGEPHEPYNSRPPTSGPHMPWIISAGVYDEPVANEYQVHLLEHGHVLLQYPAGDPAKVRRALEDLARERPDEIVVAPNPDVRTGIALTAWERIDLLPGYDERRIRRFTDTLIGRYDHGWSPGAASCG
jgi:hypothetical protein